MTGRLRLILARCALMLCCAVALLAQQNAPVKTAPPNLQGVYQTIPDSTVLTGGLKNSGAPAEISLLPEAARQAKSMDLKKDPWKACQPVGPFRMMAAQIGRAHV